MQAALLLGIAAMLAYVSAIIFYLLYPGYVDHIQPTVAAVSWLIMHGAPTYPDWHTQNVYGMLYGSLVYIVNGVFLLLSPTILMSKLPGVMAFVLAVPVFLLALKRICTDRKIIFLLLATFIVAVGSQGFYAYSNRPDSFLILIAALMLLPIPMSSYKGMIVTGLLAGIAAGFKLNAAIYALPTTLILLSAEHNMDRRLRMAGLGLAGALAMLCLPFAFGSASMLNGYLAYLSIASHHGIGRGDMLNSAWYALILAVPMAVLLAIRRPSLTRDDSVFLIGLAVVYLLTFLVACKAGAGPHHFLPFLPAYIYGIALLIKAPATRNIRLPNRVLILFIFVFLAALFGPAVYGETRKNLYLLDRGDTESAKIRDMERLIAAYPHAAVGVGSQAHYTDSEYRVVAIFRGAPLPIDVPAWMDLAFGGVNEGVLTRFITHCRIPAWVMPQGEAFSTPNGYDASMMFSENFRALFYANYALAKSGAYYQAWVCKKS